MLGERTAEEVKMTLGSAFPLPEEPEAEIRGRDMVSGLPRTVVVSSAEIRHAIEEPLHAIVDAVRSDARPDPARAGRRHHGPRHRAHRRRRPAPRPRRAAAPRDRDAGARRRATRCSSVALGAGKLRGGVRGAPAGARLGAPRSVLMVQRARPATKPVAGLERALGRPRPLDRGRAAAGAAATADHARPRRRRRLAASSRSAPPSATASGRWRRATAAVVRPFTDGRRPGSAPTTACASDIATARVGERRPARAGRPRAGYDRNRLAELDGLTAAARTWATPWCRPGWSRIGPAQSFSQDRHHRRRHRAPACAPT